MNFLKFFIFKSSWIIWRICYKIYVYFKTVLSKNYRNHKLKDIYYQFLV